MISLFFSFGGSHGNYRAFILQPSWFAGGIRER